MAKSRPPKKEPAEPTRPTPRRREISFEAGKTYRTKQSQVWAIPEPNLLPVGTHTFELVVVDDAGNESLPNRVRVVVKDTERPTAVLEAPAEVELGDEFRLDGSRSLDVPPGKVEMYKWTLVPPRATP